MYLEFHNVRRLVDFCAEIGLCVGNTYFKIWMVTSQEMMEVMTIMDLVLLKRDIRNV